MTPDKLKVLFVAAEVAPFAKVGGLADVAGALPKALIARGHDVRIAMPAYAMVENGSGVTDIGMPFSLAMGDGRYEEVYLKQTSIPSAHGEVPVYLIGNRHIDGSDTGYFAKSTSSERVYLPGPEPYVFFCRATLAALEHLDAPWQPDVIHCNDWHTGLMPVYNRLAGPHHPASVFTIHNLAYQGTFDREQWHLADLPDDLFRFDALEFYGNWSFMKGGLAFANRVNTVSKTYAHEIATPEYGCGLDGTMRHLAEHGRLYGIVNGIDYEEYDPAHDPRIAAPFSAADPSGKRLCKDVLQKELGLPISRHTALIGVVSRLSDQKGFDLIRAAAEHLLQLPIQLVVQGVGDPAYAAYFRGLEERFPHQVRACIVFDTDLAQRIYSGCDMFLMPSRFEPCGLGQLMALRYGTIPIVRATGGLADTVIDFDPETTPDGNGFCFSDYTPDALLATVHRAVDAFHSEDDWPALVERALRSDFSWHTAAVHYEELYRAAIVAKASHTHA